MKVLLTGANGFVGSHIAEKLSEFGNEVTCLVRKTSNLKWLKRLPVKFTYGNICEQDTLTEPIKNCEAVVHCAGILRAFDIQTYYKVNQIGTQNLVNAAKKYNSSLKKFVYISSQAAMGPSSEFKEKEISETENPVSDYGRSKLAGEKELLLFNKSIPYTILRPASVYGPRDKDIFIFFNLVHYGLRPRTLKKRYIQLIFVNDLSQAVIEVLQSEKSDYQTYFLAEEKFYSWEEIGKIIANSINKKTLPLPLPDFLFYGVSMAAETMSKISKKPAVLNKQKIDEMMQNYWLGDTSNVKKDLNIDFTKLEIGAKITYSWYKENKWL